MLIQKLRLQRGWSQQQLAEMSGLSTRTVQRLEAGKPASMESLKSLAAVFEVDFAHLQETTTMTSHITPTSEPLAASSSAADFATPLLTLLLHCVPKKKMRCNTCESSSGCITVRYCTYWLFVC